MSVTTINAQTDVDPRRQPKNIRVQWQDMPLIEAFLSKHDVKLERVPVPFEEIDFEKSRMVQSRLTFQLDHDFVEEIKIGIMDGTPLFRPVLYRPRPGAKYLIWDGQHRLAACRELGITLCEAYVAELPDSPDREAYADLLPRRINNLANGQRPGRAQARASVLYAASQYQLAGADIAQLFGLPRSTVYNILRDARARKQLMELTGVDVSSLADGTCNYLIRLHNNLKVLQLAVRMAVQNKMSTSQAREMVESVEAAPNEAAKLRVLSELAKTLRYGRTVQNQEGSKLVRKYNNALSALSRLNTVLAPFEKPTMENLDVPVDRRQDVADTARTLSKKLSALAKSYKK